MLGPQSMATSYETKYILMNNVLKYKKMRREN